VRVTPVAPRGGAGIVDEDRPRPGGHPLAEAGDEVPVARDDDERRCRRGRSPVPRRRPLGSGEGNQLQVFVLVVQLRPEPQVRPAQQACPDPPQDTQVVALPQT
jgi:hypothetical protein